MAGVVGSKAARASGGISTTTVGPYTVHAFTTVGANTFTPATTGFIDILLIGAGGGEGAYVNNQYYGGAGGAGATLFKKFIPVIAGTPYPISVGSFGANGTYNPSGFVSTPGTNGGSTTFVYSGITTTAAGGGGGGYYPYVNPGAAGNSVPNASGGGGGGSNPGGTGAGVLGIGFPGGAGQPGGNHSGGGGGAGGAGSVGGGGNSPGAGGPGVPITYFTGVSPNIVCIGGGNNGVYPGSFGNGGGWIAAGGPPAKPGAAYIRYI